MKISILVGLLCGLCMVWQTTAACTQESEYLIEAVFHDLFAVTFSSAEIADILDKVIAGTTLTSAQKTIIDQFYAQVIADVSLINIDRCMESVIHS